MLLLPRGHAHSSLASGTLLLPRAGLADALKKPHWTARSRTGSRRYLPKLGTMSNNDVQPATFGSVDWSAIVIEQDTEDLNLPVEEDTVYNLLGLREEDDRAMVSHMTSVDGSAFVIDAHDTEDAALPIDDHAHEEQYTVFDRDDPKMAKNG
ncbi:hypothetical protein ABZP36_028927 [Zizania latifolia]